ncbi:hypothetical protein [Paracoccus sp. Ld10]|uniref:hypothetical protein n=1 Tax=Paracoccus sp. Ld10 TaxID=649158 RepID=UPI003868BC5B
MIGVVVWSSGSREKAIIWCEDQATLAYLQGTANFAGPGEWPQPGDLVELETRTVGNLRHALNVTMLSEKICMQLPRILADAQQPTRPALRVVAHQDTVPSGAVASTTRRPATPYAQPRSGVAR